MTAARRGLLFRLLAAVLALGLSLVAAEGALRLLPAAGEYRDAPVDESRAWVEPGRLRERSPPRVLPKPEGSFRLVTVGDSYTWGDGVYPEDTYAHRLARRLRAERPGLELDLVNLSRPGWNVWEAHWWFRRGIDHLAPDLAVLGYCLNDAEPFDADQRAELRTVLGELAVPGEAAQPPAASPSLLLDRLRSSWRNLESRRRVRRYYRALYEHEPGWSAARRALAGFAQLSRERSMPFLMVIFPIFDSQLDHRYPYRDLHELARRAGEEAGLEVLDLLPVYRGIDARRLAVVPFTDPHPNELAHRIAADAIAAHLLARGMVAAGGG